MTALEFGSAVFAAKGDAASEQIDEISSQLADIERRMLKQLPLDDERTEALLNDMSRSIADPCSREQDAIAHLAQAIG